ncbi:SMI1/KNR4 family protein [Tenacibaculum sp. 190130A14a]
MIEDLLNKFKEQDEIIYTSTPGTPERLQKISELLNINLPKDFKAFLEKYGAISVRSVEINGLINNGNDLDPVHINFVGLSKEGQVKYGLFKKHIQLGDAGLGDQWVLCCDGDSENFGKVFYWNPGLKTITDMELCYDSFTSFIRTRLESVLDD